VAAQAGDLDDADEEAVPVADLHELTPGPAHEKDLRRILVSEKNLHMPAGETARRAPLHKTRTMPTPL
jgi:hypothetical protein